MKPVKAVEDVTRIVEGPESNHPGSIWWPLIIPKTVGSKRLNVSVVEYPPGTESKVRSHGDQEQCYYILRGRGYVTVEGVEYEAEPGMAFYIGLNTPHTNRVPKEYKEPLILLEIEAYQQDQRK